jgi:hypothetical protein
MSHDIRDDIRTTFEEAAAELTPPPVDRERFEARVGRVRRQRRAGLVTAATAVAALALATTYGIDVATTSGSPASSTRTGPASGEVAPAWENTTPVLAAVDGGIVLLNDTGTAPLGELGHVEDLFRTFDGALAVDGDSGLVRLRLSGDGTRGAPWEVSTVAPPSRRPIDNITVAADGRSAAWVEITDTGPRAVLYDLARDVPLASSDSGDAGSRLPAGPNVTYLAVDGTTFVTGEGDRLVYHGPLGDQVVPGLSRFQGSVSLAGDLLAVGDHGDEGPVTRLYDVSGGLDQMGSVAAGRAVLSADGSRLLAVPADADGPGPDLAWWDTADLATRRTFDDLPSGVTSGAWLDDGLVGLVSRSSEASAAYVCVTADGPCVPIGEADGALLVAGGVPLGF